MRRLALYVVGPDKLSACSTLVKLVARRTQRFEFVQSLEGCGGLQRPIINPCGTQVSTFLERKLWNRHQELFHLLLHRYEQPDVVPIPTHIHLGFVRHFLVWIRL